MKPFWKALMLAGAISSSTVLAAYVRFQRKVRADVARMFAEMQVENTGLVEEAMLEGIPEPVQRYLRYAGIIGKPFINSVRLKQIGKFRQGNDQPWMDITADEYYTVNPPGLVWNATFRIAGLPLIKGYDRYYHARGNMQGLIAAMFPIFNVRGEQLTQGTMLRYLNEMTWFPSAFLSDHITWAERDENSVDVTFHDGGKSVTATLFIDPQGRLVNFVAQRYREENGQFYLNTWETPFDEYGEMARLRLPVGGRATWKLPEGDLSYAQLRLIEIEYNVPECY
jgi:hypothetical protein